MKKLYYSGLYGDNTIEFMRGLIHVYPFGVIGKKFDGKVRLHAHNNLFQIFIVEKGTTEIQYLETSFEITAPAFITVPKNVSHGFIHKDEVSGWIITLSDAVLERMLQSDAEVVFEIDVIHITKINPDEQFLVEVFNTMKKCVEEYQANRPGKFLMLQSLVSQLIVQLYRLPSAYTKTASSLDNTSNIYFRRFLQRIKADHSFKITVDQYAKDLNITPGHLSRICQAVIGKSPKSIINDHFVVEAQIALTNVENTIAEVSYYLKFEDPAYFSRFFKKNTGISPKAFREKHGIKSYHEDLKM